jgi:hypothetical protein
VLESPIRPHVDEGSNRAQDIVATLRRDSRSRKESLESAWVTREQAAEEVCREDADQREAVGDRHLADLRHPLASGAKGRPAHGLAPVLLVPVLVPTSPDLSTPERPSGHGAKRLRPDGLSFGWAVNRRVVGSSPTRGVEHGETPGSPVSPLLAGACVEQPCQEPPLRVGVPPASPSADVAERAKPGSAAQGSARSGARTLAWIRVIVTRSPLRLNLTGRGVVTAQGSRLRRRHPGICGRA